jgi:prepilin signal peptidase PulO-like enzyme (type II secretory pathway)
MTFAFFTFATIGLLACWVILEDIRSLEVPAVPILILTVLCILCGVLFPLPGLSPDDALWGASLGLGMGTVTRGYIHWRSGVPAFGGADIALISAAGGLLGPFIFGPWLLGAAVIGIIMMLGSAFFIRETDVDGEELEVLPFCPALIISAGIAYLMAWQGWIPAALTG